MTTPTKLTVPLRKLSERQYMSLHTKMLDMGNVGMVASGAGLGSDAIWLKWKGETYYVRGAELLRALVRIIDAPDADAFPDGIDEAQP